MIDLKDYTGQKSKHHVYYSQSVDAAKDMLIHFDGIFPDKLIGNRRPAESVTIFKFRKEIYVCPTQDSCDKITNSLMKIRKSQDWMIKYPDSPSKIAKEETFENYMEKDFPKWRSFTNWYFGIGLKTYLTDSNAVVLWMPRNMNFKDDVGNETTMPDNAYYKPYPTIFKSDQVIDYGPDWYLLKSKETCTYRVEKTVREDGFIYYYVNDTSIFTMKQTDGKGSYSVEEFPHGLEEIPVVHFGGVVQDENSTCTLYRSRISAILAYFKEAVREYSDLQAEVLQHIHSTFWALEGQECRKCKGVGSIPVKDKPAIQCEQCFGRGTYPVHPYEFQSVKRPKAGEAAISAPFMGYVQKQIDIAILQDKRIRAHKKDGLSAINMEFLVDPPQLDQSGIAKMVDRAELNNFVHAIAEDIVSFFDRSYRIVCNYRYTGVIPNKETREELIPIIPVPEKFDIVSETYLAGEIEQLQRFNANTSVINALLIEYTNKKFNAEPAIADFVKATISLDPFSSEKEDYVLMRLQNNGISEQSYVIHCNVKDFVMRAITEIELGRKIDKTKPTFYALPFDEQQTMIEGYADEFITDNSAKGQVMSVVNNSNNLPLDNQQAKVA